MNKKNNINRELTRLEIDMANKLIDLLNTKPYVTYKELAGYFNLGADHIAHQLGNIDMVCFRLGIPLISANVVNIGTDQPNSEGFIRVLEECKIPLNQYDNVIKKARENKDWSKLVEELRKIYNMCYNKNM